MVKIISFLLATFLVFGLNINLYGQNNKLIDLQKWEERLAEKEKLLNEREQRLNSKERELNIMLEELKKENARLEEREKEIEMTKNKMEELKKEIKYEEDQNLDRLAKIYSSTKAKEAAKIIVEMDVDKAVKLFQRMRPMTAGEILGAIGKINPQFASIVSEKLAAAGDNASYTQ
jgi:flagellar motility protein MotE (MotC chaperone)